MRMQRDARRAARSAGNMAVRKFSNGILSRKKNVSLVVMASTTIVIRHSLSPRRSAATSSPKFAKPALRAIGSKRLSTRYCLSADSTKPDRSPKQTIDLGRDLPKRKTRRAQSGKRNRARHTPHPAGFLILSNHTAAGGGNLGGAAGAVRAHPGQNERQASGAPDLRGRCKQWIDRRPAKIDRRV